MLNESDVYKNNIDNKEVYSDCLSMQTDLEQVHELALYFSEIAFESYEKEMISKLDQLPVNK